MAHAVIGPHDTFLDDPPEDPPRDVACLFDNCDLDHATLGATQSFDCDYAGLGEPSTDLEMAQYSPTTDELLLQQEQAFNYKLFPSEGDFLASEWPGANHGIQDIGAGEGPSQGAHTGPLGATGLRMQNQMFGSFNFQTPPGGLGPGLQRFVNQQVNIGGTSYTSVLFENHNRGLVQHLAISASITMTPNFCRVVLLPTDPHYTRTGRHGGNSWGEKEDDQWAIKRVGFTGDEDSAWNAVSDDAAPVIVAVIDSGLDWHHADIHADNIWRNAGEDPGNGVDDDRNGYVDDVIGWNFVGQNNRPWDFDGHGTVVTGIIAAAHNDAGIAGLNPNVRIMVLKGVNNFGTSRASFIAEAIVYAVDNGAQIINISVGGSHVSDMEQAAIDFAKRAGVLVVAASGNEGIELGDFGPGGNDNVLTVGATHVDDRAAGFSNYGDKVDLVAPGVDVLSLRARYTDANYRPGPDGDGEYKLGDNYVGDDKRYLHVSGTSFSTPIVTGVASLVWSKNPEFTAKQVESILLQTARDVDRKGRDQYTGHGMVDARAALSVGPDFSVTAEITRVELVPSDAPQFARVYGTIDASEFKRAWMQIGPGENPGGWRYVGPKRKFPIRDSELGIIPIRQFAGADLWQVVVNVEHKNGVIKRAAFPITVN